jgi:hypothetical protein
VKSRGPKDLGEGHRLQERLASAASFWFPSQEVLRRREKAGVMEVSGRKTGKSQPPVMGCCVSTSC